MAAVRVRTPAKVNLTLEVLRRRNDGYHEVTTILQAIDLWDELVVREADQLSFRCNVAELEGPENLVVRAARLLAKEAGIARGAAMELRKHIPVAAGLGGGSSDAAAALLALDHLWGLGLPRSQLGALAAELGSDAPFFLYGGTAVASGRGERVALLAPCPTAWLVLAVPRVSLPRKTATLYASLTPADYADGSATARLEGLLKAGKAVADDCFVNAFERTAFQVFPGLARHAEAMMAAGAQRVHLAGSGPALFTVVQDEGVGRPMAERLARGGLETWCVKTVSSGPLFEERS